MPHDRIAHRIIRWLAPVILAGVAPLMVLGGPAPTSHPLYPAVWNLGHLAWFGLLTIHLRAVWPWLRGEPAWVRLLALNAAILVLGVAVEMAQNGLGRAPGWHDVWRNHLGVLGAWLLTGGGPARARRPALVLWCALVAWELLLIGQVARAHRAIQAQLPVIAALEQAHEVARWSGDVALTDTVAAHGQVCLAVRLGTARYSGTGTRRIPHDWRGYDTLAFALHNPRPDTLKLTLRINDRRHDQRYEDRFNRRLLARPGWTRVRIPLADVRDAPRDRAMDMSDIFQLGIFATRLPAPRTIHLDHVRLQ